MTKQLKLPSIIHLRLAISPKPQLYFVTKIDTIFFYSTTMTQRGSRVVLVENISYELTEDQLIEVFKEVGPVVSFKLVFDRESGRPKGYGFCEYYDAETAASAVRNLNNYELEGRLLRVDFADVDPQLSSLHSPKPQQFPTAQQQTLTTLPSMNPAQMLDVIVHMKTLVHSSPDQARAFLAQNPQLTYALFQSMVTLGIADTAVVHRILAQQYAPPPQNIVSTPPTLSVPVPVPAPTVTPVPALAHPQVRPQYTPAYPVFPQQPSIPQMPFQPNPLVDVQEQQKALLMQVLQLTQQQIDSLPPEQRQNVIALKQQILMSQQPH